MEVRDQSGKMGAFNSSMPVREKWQYFGAISGLMLCSNSRNETDFDAHFSVAQVREFVGKCLH
jgi:hypothetical protein